MFLSCENELISILGIGQGDKVKFINQPESFTKFFVQNFPNVELIATLNKKVDFIFLFSRSRNELLVELPVLAKYITQTGKLIVSIPNPNLNSTTDLKEEFLLKLSFENSLIMSKKIVLDGFWDTYVNTKSEVNY